MTTSILTPQTRKILYTAFAILMILAGAFQTGYSAAEMPQPIWLVVSIQVLAYVGGAFGFTAAVHTDTSKNTATATVEPETQESSLAEIGDFTPEANDLTDGGPGDAPIS